MRRLRFTKRALRQIEKALGYVERRSPGGAMNIASRIERLLRVVQQQPNMGGKIRVTNVRRVFLLPYPCLIDYYVGDDEIVVQRFRHTSRRPMREPREAR